jgi:hypothetical protein
MKRILSIVLISAALISNAAYAEDRLPTWTGGIGLAERELIEQKQNDYTLKLVLIGEKGMYVSRVTVKITDKAGTEVVNTMTQGPVLLADLEPGRYTVEASAEGTTKTFHVTVGATLKTQHVLFPIKDTSGV